MISRVEAKKEYVGEVIERLKGYSSLSKLDGNAWKIIQEELTYAFSAGVDFNNENSR